jgi:hypothetical protein
MLVLGRSKLQGTQQKLIYRKVGGFGRKHLVGGNEKDFVSGRRPCWRN